MSLGSRTTPLCSHRGNPRWPLVLSVVGALACAQAAANQSTLGMLTVVLLIAGSGALFLFTHKDLIFWLLVFTAPFTDKLGVNVGPANVRPYNLLACAGLAWMVWQLIEHRQCMQWKIVTYFKPLFSCIVRVLPFNLDPCLPKTSFLTIRILTL